MKQRQVTQAEAIVRCACKRAIRKNGGKLNPKRWYGTGHLADLSHKLQRRYDVNSTLSGYKVLVTAVLQMARRVGLGGNAQIKWSEFDGVAVKVRFVFCRETHQ